MRPIPSHEMEGRADAGKPSNPGSRVISIGGGKGGVGKSLVATNLAVAIAQTGRQVVLCDLDLGAANLHLMLGATQARAGIQALLAPTGELEEALTPTRVPGLRLLAGTGGTVAAANITHAQKLRIIRKLRSLKSDFIVVDVGAGVGYNALDFFELGQQRIIVATPQVTSMHDAYAFLKGAVLRTLKHHAGRSDEAWMLDPALSTRDGEKVKDLLMRVREQDPRFGEKIEKILKHFGSFLIGNQVENPGQVGVFQAVSRMVEDFLGISLPILGWIPHHGKLSDSVNDRIPFMARADKADTREARAFRAVVEALLVGDMAPEEELLVELVEEGLQAEPVPEINPASPEVTATMARPAPPPIPATPPPPVPAAVLAEPARVPGPPPVPTRRLTPPGPQVELVAAPPPAPVAAPPVPEDAAIEVDDLDDDADAEAAATPGGPSDETPALVMPRIYVRPPKRKRKADSEEKKRRRALDAEGRRRKLTLPGMPPTRVKSP